MSQRNGVHAASQDHGALAPLLHEIFSATHARHAGRVAVEVPPGRDRAERIRWTYEALDAAAAQVARELSPRVGVDAVVAILLPRESPWLLAAQLGILRAGAAWTALDLAFPPEHARFLLEDAAPVALITDGPGRRRALALGVPSERILVAEGPPPTRAAPPTPRPPWQGPSSLAYVIYTSGTTGRPKGVLVEHGSIVRLVTSDADRFGLGPDDRVAQNSSAAYDSSIEETWLALAVGATVVVLDDETVRLGPDLASWLARERITAFCPPPTLLRTMGCEDPARSLPELRFLYVGGEPLTEDVAAVWGRDRWLENGYGPTEGTVTSLRTRIRPGEAVTIGRPVPGTRAHVLDEDLGEVPEGEVGELCLAGACLARGYLGRPELTQERFPIHPRLGRLYRTGDLVRRDGAGDHHYVGRADSQVKVRGHRIELSAVEAALATLPGVLAAACRVQGEGAAQVLAAHVVARDPEAPPDRAALELGLSRLLPAAMVPSRWAFLTVLPTNRSGKLDRGALPVLGAAAPASDRPHVAPRDELEAAIARVVERVLQTGGPVSVEDDLFLGVGATSISVAGIVSLLREEPRTSSLAVRDVYEARTVAGLAARAAAGDAPPAVSSQAPQAPVEVGRPAVAAAVQAAWLSLVGLAASGLFYLGWFVLLPFLLARLGVVGTLATLPIGLFLARLAWAPLAVLLLVGVKRALIGRYRAQRAPAWGSFHVRHWIVKHLAGLVPWGLISDTAVLFVVLRALGARVGRGVNIHRGVDLRSGGWDLLDLGDDVTVGQDAALRLVTLDQGEVVVGPVTLGPGATLDVRAGMDGHSSLGAGAYLTALSWLPSGARIPAGEAWDGVPARPRGAAPPVPRPDHGRELSSSAFDRIALLVRFLRAALPYYVLVLPLTLLGFAPGDLAVADVMAWIGHPFGSPGVILGLLGVLVGARVLELPLAALGLRLLGRVPLGVMPQSSLGYLRVLAKTEAVEQAGAVLAGTLFWPLWLRWAGMSVGRRCELSTIVDVVPECIEIGDETFLADGIYLGGPRLHRGTVTVAPTRIGRSSFFGNHVVVPAGTTLPDDVLFGVATVAGSGQVRPGTSWFGHPAFELPRREVVKAPRSLTHEPNLGRYLTRLFWESARFALPIVPALLVLGWLEAARRGVEASGWAGTLVVLWGASLLAGATACLLVLAVKWALLGRMRPGQRAFWSCWCGRWDFLYVAWEAWARRPLAALEGTPFLVAYLRAMGCRIGRRTLLGSGFAQVVDPDMLTIEDGATVHALIQAHSFEDRVLKMDHVRIGRGATVGSQAVLLYGADIGDGARVAPHAVVMKHERLGARTSWEGFPTRPWRPAARPLSVEPVPVAALPR